MSEQDGVKTPEEFHAEQVDRPGASAAEVETLHEAGPQPLKSVPVQLGNGVTIQVPMQSTWRVSAMDLMRQGDFIGWAETVLAEADLDAFEDWYAPEKVDDEPDMAAITDFFERVGKATGQAAGGNRASRRASMRTRRS
jgi:hypothetical protein